MLLLVVALLNRAWGQQAPSPAGDSMKPSPTIIGDEGSRSYVPSLFGTQPIAVDIGRPSIPSNEPPPPVGITDSSDSGSGAVEPWAPYVRNPAQHYLLYGLTASGSFEHDTATGGPSDSISGSSLSPYLALMGRTRTGYYTLQYAPSIVPYDSETRAVSAFHNLALDAAGNFNRRLKWNFDMRNGYGGEVSRLTGNLNPQTVVAGVPVADPSYASLQPLNGNSLNTAATFGIGYQLTPRETLGVTLSNSYSTFLNGDPQLQNAHSDIASLGLTFDRSVSARATFRAYATGSRVFSNLLPCDSYSGGLGMLYKPARAVAIDVGAGPSTGCGSRSYNFHGTVTGSLHNGIQLYVSGSRQLNTQYRLNSLWEDNVTAGAGRRFRSTDLGVDGGYYHGQSLGLVAPSQGYFISPRINYGLRLSRFTSVGVSCRRYHSALSAGASQDINMVLISLTLSPSPVPLER